MEDRTRLRSAAAGIIVAILAMLVLAADQFTKHLALDNLPYQQAVPVWGDVLQLYLTRNSGAAFSLGENVTWVFTIVLACAAMVIVALAVRGVRSRWWAVILGLLLGGILGNLTDRLVREPGFAVGHVIDFIYTPWMMPAIYNVADMFIVTSMIAVALLVLVGLRLDGTRSKDAEVEADAADDDAADAAKADVDAGDDATPAAADTPARGESI